MKSIRYIILIAFGCILSIYTLTAQKPPIDTSDFNAWPSIRFSSVTGNGKFISYTLQKGNDYYFGNKAKTEISCLSDITGKWKKEIPQVQQVLFTEDSRYAVYQLRDTLCLLTLGTDEIKYITGVRDFVLASKDIGNRLAYRTLSPSKELVCLNLLNGSKISFLNADDYVLGKNATRVFYKSITDSATNTQKMFVGDLISGRSAKIWEGINSGNLIFSDDSASFCFMEERKDQKVVWFYDIHANSMRQILEGNSSLIPKSFSLEAISGFIPGGSKILIALNPVHDRKIPGLAAVDVWNYRDSRLQSWQLLHTESFSMSAVLSVHEKKLVIVEKSGKGPVTAINDKLILTDSTEGDELESYWNKTSLNHHFLVSCEDGTSKEIAPRIYGLLPSSGRRYLYGYNSVGSDIFIFEVATNQIRNVTKDLPIPSFEYPEFYVSETSRSRGLRVAGWLENDEALIVYDKYDIWKIDPSGRNSPVNLTNGFGRKNNIILRFSGLTDNEALRLRSHTLLVGFNLSNKDNGFFRLSQKMFSDPKLLTMGPYVYITTAAWPYGLAPVKATNAEVYIVARESANESSNFYMTKDFTHFSRITDNYPEKKYNWLTAELLSFKTSDGKRTEQGILYKPENFDSTKKYPLIIHYYELRSNEVNLYRKPEVPISEINIPWYVSNGYLVFIPDIHYAIGQPLECARSSIVGAAKFLSQTYAWIDARHIGLQGHSWGGTETSYVIAHSDIFAAAYEGAGISDYIGGYNAIYSEGYVGQWWYESGQLRAGSTLWENQDAYIKNSAVLFADKIETPLLIMHNKNDNSVPFRHGAGLFTALRRMGKRVWLLQYDNEGHGIINSYENAVDCMIRVHQFYDHYLKGEPPPVWLTKGVPAIDKGIKAGLELDNEIKTPGEGLVSDTSGKKLAEDQDVR